VECSIQSKLSVPARFPAHTTFAPSSAHRHLLIELVIEVGKSKLYNCVANGEAPISRLTVLTAGLRPDTKERRRQRRATLKNHLRRMIGSAEILVDGRDYAGEERENSLRQCLDAYKGTQRNQRYAQGVLNQILTVFTVEQVLNKESEFPKSRLHSGNLPASRAVSGPWQGRTAFTRVLPM
jgi:hypothetical protein